MKTTVVTAAQVFSGILIALWIDGCLDKTFAKNGPVWLSGLVSAIIAAAIVSVVVNFVFARPTLVVHWTEFSDSAPLGKLDVRLPTGVEVSSHFRVDISVKIHSAVAAFVVWRLRKNGTRVRITFPNAGVRPTIEDPLCTEDGRPLCSAKHEHVDFELLRNSNPKSNWTHGTVTFSPRVRVGDQTTDVDTRLANQVSGSSRYARIVVIDAEVGSIRVREN